MHVINIFVCWQRYDNILLTRTLNRPGFHLKWNPTLYKHSCMTWDSDPTPFVVCPVASDLTSEQTGGPDKLYTLEAKIYFTLFYEINGKAN